MSRSVAVRAARDSSPRAPRRHAPAVARRVSGPLQRERTASETRMPAVSEAASAARPRMPSRPPLRLAAGGASVALRVADAALEVTGSRTMDRLVRSRAWVVIVGFALIGIVAMQVSMLKLNAGIGRAVETAATLERGNAALRGQISRLSSGDRIQALAGARGFVMPEPADVKYLRAASLRGDGAKAARRMVAPDRAIAGPAGAATATAPAPPTANAPAAPAATAQAATSAASTPAPHTHAPAQTGVAAPASTPPAVTAAPAAAATPQAAPTGGVTVP